MTKTFRDLGVDAALCDALDQQGITHPFPIQELTLPLALEGHDLIGQARTGTGKTLAFGLPLLQRLDPGQGHTQALVIVPTRELCLQVHSDLQIGSALGLTSISVYGGVGYDEQIDALTAGAHVVVGTPGRLLDLLNRGVLDLSYVTQLVLDEADEMLDMGFLPDVERLVESCQGDDRHTMLFSATMPTAIVKLARRYMDHPTFTRADHEQKNTAPLVTQYFFEVHRMDKPRLLARLLQSKDRGGVYVFVRTKHMADRLVNDLEELRVPAIAIHGDLRQATREKNLDRFRSGQATVLVCTEVAARGLDVSGVTHVVNYDCPDDEKMYLHRIGRTARAGEAGVAVTFAEFNEIDRLNVIRKAVGAAETEVQQIFSTSKQLVEMFDLPDERPWDHLSTKSGSDEARAKRESRSDGNRETRDGKRPSRSDGKPKSGRAQEGRGGDHDARRSGKSEGTRSGKPEGTRSRREQPGDRGAARDTTSTTDTAPAAVQEPAVPDAATERDGADGRTRERRSNTARTNDERTGDERTGDGRASDEARTRTRTRTRSRSATGSRGDAAETPKDATETPKDATKGSARGSGSGRQRARGGVKRTDAASSDAAAPQTTESDRDTSSKSGAKGEQRDRAGRGDRSKGASAEKPRAKAKGSDGARSQGRGKGSDRTPAESGARSGGRDSSRSGRGGNGADRSSEADPTVRVAPRGEDARGEGQPQVARRVKVEHLP